MGIINRILGEDGRITRAKRREEFASNLIGNRKAMLEAVTTASAMDTVSFCTHFPTARRAWLLPIKTALDSGITFDKDNAIAQQILTETDLIPLLNQLIDPINGNDNDIELIFNQDTGKFEQATFINSINNQQPSVKFNYKIYLAASTKRTIAQHDLLFDTIFSLGLISQQTFIEIEKDSDIMATKQIEKQLGDIAKEATNFGITFLKGAKAVNLGKDVKTYVDVLAEQRTKIASDVGIPQAVLFEQKDASSIFNGKTSNQMRFEHSIAQIQSSILMPFYRKAFKLVPQLSGRTFSIPQAFGRDKEHWQTFNVQLRSLMEEFRLELITKEEYHQAKLKLEQEVFIND
ncbi:MAG: DUF1073 domain-containing protein [Spirochaetaceae bacterium]|nr:DUF1073 domain-containing protein [Spirochaetaceae bacterium]